MPHCRMDVDGNSHVLRKPRQRTPRRGFQKRQQQTRASTQTLGRPKKRSHNATYQAQSLVPVNRPLGLHRRHWMRKASGPQVRGRLHKTPLVTSWGDDTSSAGAVGNLPTAAAAAAVAAADGGVVFVVVVVVVQGGAVRGSSSAGSVRGGVWSTVHRLFVRHGRVARMEQAHADDGSRMKRGGTGAGSSTSLGLGRGG